MPLIDRLVERAFDEATHSYRSRRDRSARQTDELIEALREYSSEIERMRIGYVRLRDALDRGGDLTSNIPRRPSAPSLPDAFRELPESSRDNPRAQAELLAQEQAQLLLERTIPAVAVLRGTVAIWHDAETRSVALEEEWARLRPLLDDTLEIEAVAYLRAFRHDLRYLLREANARISDLATAPPVDDVGRSISALAAIDDVLLAADLWNAHVAGVRRDIVEK